MGDSWRYQALEPMHHHQWVSESRHTLIKRVVCKDVFAANPDYAFLGLYRSVGKARCPLYQRQRLNDDKDSPQTWRA